MKYLTRKDEIMLLAILRLKEGAYLVTLRQYLNGTTRMKWSVGNVFVSLEKLENGGYIESFLGEPTAIRGGKAKKYYRVTPAGMNALRDVRSLNDELWDGLAEVVGAGDGQ